MTAILQQLHDGAGGGHFGIKKTKRLKISGADFIELVAGMMQRCIVKPVMFAIQGKDQTQDQEEDAAI